MALQDSGLNVCKFVMRVNNLHTAGVVVSVVVDHAVPHDLLFAHGARLLVGLVAVGAIGLLIFREELSIEGRPSFQLRRRGHCT